MDAARPRPAAAIAASMVVLALALTSLAAGSWPPPAAAASGAPKIGIADQKQSVFTDQRLLDLGLRYARRSVAWDALRFKSQRRELDAWMAGARAAGMQPLISFARSRRAGGAHSPPSPEQLLRAFRRFRERYPEVRTYSSWNEANHCGTGTCNRPDLVARYYRTIRRACPSCTLLAADLNDHPDPVPWVRAFRHELGYEPALWGYHNYIDANRMQTTLTARLLRAIRGQLWLTEVGGIVARRNNSTVAMPQGRSRAALVTRFIFDSLARLSPRITRVYVYHWSAESRQDTWDSAFISPGGTPRPSLNVFRTIVRADATHRTSRASSPRGPLSSRSRAGEVLWLHRSLPSF